jgi:small subunit ribosomal protein S10e
MFVTKKDRAAVYSYLFKEGVLVAKKDFFKKQHDEIEVANLEVLMLMKSMKSREYVRETFNWQYYYWYLTPEGIEYLREFLHLPQEIVPATLKKTATARPARPGPAPGGEGPGGFRDKKMGPGGDFNPDYQRGGGGGGGGGQDGYRRGGGFGRGGGGEN